jgi:hypothetical protein
VTLFTRKGVKERLSGYLNILNARGSAVANEFKKKDASIKVIVSALV